MVSSSEGGVTILMVGGEGGGEDFETGGIDGGAGGDGDGDGGGDGGVNGEGEGGGCGDGDGGGGDGEGGLGSPGIRTSMVTPAE